MNEIIEGFSNSIKNLNINDRFEIVAFKDRAYSLFGSLEHPNKDNITEAENFLRSLSQSGSTDLYSALIPFVNGAYNAENRPLVFIVASDGIVNTGDIVSSSKLINHISSANEDLISIFTFTNSKESNSFFLELLAYKNKGEFCSSEISKGSSKLLSDKIKSIDSIILDNLKYQISADLTDLTFPKRLPNIYMDHSLNIYGRYDLNNEKVSLRITGKDKDGNFQELVYSESFENAIKSDNSLAKEWAQQYIYYLYSLLTVEHKDDIKKEISNIARKYSISINSLKAYR